MTSSNSAVTRPGILGLFTELLGVGGIQEAGRQAVAALTNMGARRDCALTFLGLNDPAGPQTVDVRGKTIPLRGFHRAKIRFVIAALLQSRKNVRIVLAAHPNLAEPAALAKRFFPRIRTVVVTHGIEVWQPLSAARRKALLAADRVLAPSVYTAQMLAEVQGVPNEKILRLAWPLDPAFLSLADDPSSLLLPSHFPLGSTILTVGRWAASEKYKGADQLIRCMPGLRASFPSLSLVVVGNGDDLPRLKKIAADLGAGESVCFLEGLSRRQVAACYARCDVFALPSTGEGFGFVFLEAMAFGKPVIGVAKGGSIDLIRDGINGFLLEPENLPALAQTLERLLRDPSLRAQLGRHGAQIVRSDYSIEAFERNLDAILAPLLG